MKLKILVVFWLVIITPCLLIGQADSVSGSGKIVTHYGGFIRGGCYGTTGDGLKNIYVSSAFSDIGLKVESTDGVRFRAFADVRFRYGSEFLEPVSSIGIKEAYITINGKRWDISVGQKIIKWGRADFTNPTSKLNPQNFISRSPDPDDMDLGNLLASVRWMPLPLFAFEAVAVPYYRPSVLITEPIPLPSYVTIDQDESLVTDRKMFSYGLKADLHANRVDMSLSWFDGYDPMPGIELSSLNVDLSGPYPIPYITLSTKPYRTRNIGFDFETTAGSVGLRGEAAYTIPYDSYRTYEYVPCKEIKWVLGADWSTGNWRFTWEYEGKTIPGFESSSVSPLFGTEMDMSQLATLLATPGFDFNEYLRQEVAAFNRLYNYQLERYYHSAGIRIESDLFYGKLTPSLFTMYNLTTRDLLVMPELRYKPADGLTIYAGLDFYSGRKGSIYDIIDDFMNCLRAAIKIDF